VSNGGLHVRPSGNMPEIWTYTESSGLENKRSMVRYAHASIAAMLR
jgi:phosphomannomutase